MEEISTKSSEPLTQIIRTVVTTRLKEHHWNMTRTAESLGISVRVLRNWVRLGQWPYDHYFPAAPKGVEPPTSEIPPLTHP